MNYDSTDITSLGAKLDALDLSDGERHILDVALSRQDDTAGFGRRGYGVKIGALLDSFTGRNPYDRKDSILDATQGAGILDATQGAGILDATQGAG